MKCSTWLQCSNYTPTNILLEVTLDAFQFLNCLLCHLQVILNFPLCLLNIGALFLLTLQAVLQLL